MKYYLTISILMFFVLETNAQNLNSMLNSANQAVYNSISPVKQTNTNTSVLTNHISIIVPNAEPVKLGFDYTILEFDFSNLPKPSQGILNNPNQTLFRNNSMINYNEILTNYNKIKW
jgi:hypothetical protein